MPTKVRDLPQDDPKFALPQGKKDDEEFMMEVRERFERCQESDDDLRTKAIEDIKFAFVEGEQWDAHMKQMRANRPCYEFNRVRQSIRQVTGDQLQNQPGIKIRPFEDGDEDTAEIFQGLIRNIESVSSADRAYDNAFTYSVTGGYGVWRVATQYSDDESFDQDIVIKPVRNPFSVYFDYAAHEQDRRDARFAFVVDTLPRQVFRAKYPKADMIDFDSAGTDQMRTWWGEENVQIAEYWYKEPYTKTILLLSNGDTVDKADFNAEVYMAQQPAQPGQPPPQPITVVREREAECERVFVSILSGSEVLEGPDEWAGKFIPLVPVWGDVINVDGRDIWSGMVRPAKDAQRLHNFSTSTAIEMVGDQPIQPFMASTKSIKGNERQWENMNVDRSPVLFYNADSTLPNGGMPMRSAPPAFPAAWANISAIATNEIKATLGVYDASLGAPSNETSGKAILARQKEGDTANFVYVDNLNKALKYSGEILVDLIPKIYDAERSIRILGEDGAAKYIKLYDVQRDRRTGQLVTLNNIAVGKYDVAITTGPSYTTQRMETAEAMMQLASAKGPFGELAQYTFLKSLDTPGLDEIQAAARKILVNQGLLQPDADDPPPQPKPPSIADASMQGQQITALTAILTDVGSGALSPHTAVATIMAAFPTLNPQLVAEMVQQSQQVAQGAANGNAPTETADNVAAAQLKQAQAIHHKAQAASILANIQPSVQKSHADAARAAAEAALFLHSHDVRVDLGVDRGNIAVNPTNPAFPGQGQ